MSHRGACIFLTLETLEMKIEAPVRPIGAMIFYTRSHGANVGLS